MANYSTPDVYSFGDNGGYDELVFNRFMMDCMGKDIPIIWEDML